MQESQIESKEIQPSQTEELQTEETQKPKKGKKFRFKKLLNFFGKKKPQAEETQESQVQETQAPQIEEMQESQVGDDETLTSQIGDEQTSIDDEKPKVEKTQPKVIQKLQAQEIQTQTQEPEIEEIQSLQAEDDESTKGNGCCFGRFCKSVGSLLDKCKPKHRIRKPKKHHQRKGVRTLNKYTQTDETPEFPRMKRIQTDETRNPKGAMVLRLGEGTLEFHGNNQPQAEEMQESQA
ncbi:hypothetical protein QVD99_001666 [Batrachochytrium dendrobatidis]|nr:hypothetical protein QVD99_001666 [Batrachochytrium dendrobatidis]